MSPLTHALARTAAKVPSVNICKVFSVSDICRRTLRCGGSAACSPTFDAASWRSRFITGLVEGLLDAGAPGAGGARSMVGRCGAVSVAEDAGASETGSGFPVPPPLCVQLTATSK